MSTNTTKPDTDRAEADITAAYVIHLSVKVANILTEVSRWIKKNKLRTVKKWKNIDWDLNQAEPGNRLFKNGSIGTDSLLEQLSDHFSHWHWFHFSKLGTNAWVTHRSMFVWVGASCLRAGDTKKNFLLVTKAFACSPTASATVRLCSHFSAIILLTQQEAPPRAQTCTNSGPSLGSIYFKGSSIVVCKYSFWFLCLNISL